MKLTFGTQAEKRAAKAEDYQAFCGVKLMHIREQVAEVLKLVGRDGFFREYTLHDISHIDAMLRSLDWLVPVGTKNVMSPADWLLTVLAIYLHDFGMVITEDEFNARAGSGFAEFCRNVLFAGDDGQNYKARVERQFTNSTDSERFLYQEFVRHNHPSRVAAWINGEDSKWFGAAAQPAVEVQKLLSHFDDTFRADLALVCESHHLDDLGNMAKYSVSKPYGNSAQETANVQYAGILLRSADLLHITKDRTPTIVFRVINPADPTSQQEWAKQMAVRTVRPKTVVFASRKRSAEPGDTIEVHATFTNAEGFFGLTSFLKYAETQLQRSNAWADESKKKAGVAHSFPWRRIDDSTVEATGFIPKPFYFELDQRRILELLTGHTLYNNSNVVVRELIQNALDAVRLQELLDRRAGKSPQGGRVVVSWDSSSRKLSVRDSGTGMTQNTVERHLLRVGASRYQDPDFRKSYPEFSPISRFGIGVLSYFMVADEIEITTVSQDESEGRSLTLRSVHGRYLIRLFKKGSEANQLSEHGTEVVVRLRPTAQLGDLIALVRHWVVIPDCTVEVIVDRATPVRVGYATVSDALQAALGIVGLRGLSESDPFPDVDERGAERVVRIIEREVRGTVVAFAVEWSDYFQSWSFLEIMKEVRGDKASETEAKLLLGTCVQGVRVERGTPGYTGVYLAVLANATGPSAPRTNVARSAIEEGTALNSFLTSVYETLTRHVHGEISKLSTERGFSLTWATDEAAYFASLLVAERASVRLRGREELMSVLNDLPALTSEIDGQRVAVSPAFLQSHGSFWTSDSALLRSAELLLKQVGSATSLSDIAAALGPGYFDLPNGVLLSSRGSSGAIGRAAFREKDVERLEIKRARRRVDLLWSAFGKSPRWTRLMNQEFLERYRQLAARAYEGSDGDDARTVLSMRVALGDVHVIGGQGELAVKANGALYVLPTAQVATLLAEIIGNLNGQPSLDDELFGFTTLMFFAQRITARSPAPLEPQAMRDFFGRRSARLIERLDLQRTIDAFAATDWKIFDPAAWVRP